MRSVFAFRIFLFVYLLLMHVSGANAQINKILNEFGLYPSVSVSICKEGSSFFLSGGYIVNGSFQILCLMKADSEFIVNNILTYTDSIHTIWTGNKNLAMQNDKFFISFHTRDSLDNTVSKLLIIDANLQIIDVKTFASTTGYFAGLNLTQHPEGGFILTGEVRETPPVAHDIFILRTDSLGNELWRRTYGQPGVNESPGRAFHIQGEEYFVPLGREYEFLDGSKSQLGFLLKSVSNQTNIEKSFHRDWQFEFAFLSIIKDLDGNYSGAGVYSNGNGNQSSFVPITKGRFTKINASMEVIVDIEIGDFYSPYSGFTSIWQNSDSTYILVGRSNDNFQGNNVPVSWFCKLKDTNILWQRRIYFYSTTSGAQNLKYDFTATPDGGYAICGYAMDDTHNQQIWVVKTDSFGCVVPGCQMYDSVENPEELLSMKLFPNPAQDFLNIFVPPGKDREDVRIYDSRGALVQSLRLLPAAATTMVYIRNLAPGLYFLSSDGEAIKFVKE